MNTLERIIFGMKDLESRFDRLGEVRSRYKNMPKEEYPSYRQLIYAYLNDLKPYTEIYSKVSDDMRRLADMLRTAPENGKAHRKNMVEYIKTLKEINHSLEDIKV